MPEGWKYIGYCSEPVEVERSIEAGKDYLASFRNSNHLQRSGAAAVFISNVPPPEPAEVALHPARLARLRYGAAAA